MLVNTKQIQNRIGYPSNPAVSLAPLDSLEATMNPGEVNFFDRTVHSLTSVKNTGYLEKSYRLDTMNSISPDAG
jgi:hypothetical protein